MSWDTQHHQEWLYLFLFGWRVHLHGFLSLRRLHNLHQGGAGHAEDPVHIHTHLHLHLGALAGRLRYHLVDVKLACGQANMYQSWLLLFSIKHISGLFSFDISIILHWYWASTSVLAWGCQMLKNQTLKNVSSLLDGYFFCPAFDLIFPTWQPCWK